MTTSPSSRRQKPSQKYDDGTGWDVPEFAGDGILEIPYAVVDLSPT
jgi:hypothetical protein